MGVYKLRKIRYGDKLCLDFLKAFTVIIYMHFLTAENRKITFYDHIRNHKELKTYLIVQDTCWLRCTAKYSHVAII